LPHRGISNRLLHLSLKIRHRYAIGGRDGSKGFSSNQVEEPV
jgi:hypothetical protein